MKIHDLKPSPGAKSARTRVGRGIGGKGGKTAGRGTKGQHARNTVPVGFEGGQTPLHRRIPKGRGFNNPFRVSYEVVNVERLNVFDAGTVVTPELMRERGLVPKKGLVKVLGSGSLDTKLNVRAHAFSKSAVAAIEGAGGSTVKLDLPFSGVRPASRGSALTNR